MSEVNRLHKYLPLISSRRALNRLELVAHLEMSSACVKSEKAELRNPLGINNQFESGDGGYGNSTLLAKLTSLFKTTMIAFSAVMSINS